MRTIFPLICTHDAINLSLESRQIIDLCKIRYIFGFQFLHNYCLNKIIMFKWTKSVPYFASWLPRTYNKWWFTCCFPSPKLTTFFPGSSSQVCRGNLEVRVPPIVSVTMVTTPCYMQWIYTDMAYDREEVGEWPGGGWVLGRSDARSRLCCGVCQS